MKKVSALFVLLLFQSATVFAAPAGSGKTLAQRDYAIGFEYNTIFEKEMKPVNPAEYTDSLIKGSDQFSGTLTYGFFNNGRFSMDVSGKVGVADLSIQSTDTTFFRTEKIEYEQGFLWGAGGRVAYQFKNQLSVSLNGQYNQWHADFNEIKYNGETGYNVLGSNKARVTEFQAAVLLTWEVKNKQTGLTFVPYAGPSLNITDVHTGDLSYETNTITSSTLDAGMKRASDPYGLIIGLEIYGFNEHLKLSIEGRFLYEEALTLSLHYNF